MSKFAIALIGIVFVVAVTTADNQDAWDSFKLRHGKYYTNSTEEQKRRKIFDQKLKEIAEHNKQYEAGNVTYEKGTNEFSDMTHDEFRRKMSGYGSSVDDDDDDWQTHDGSDYDEIPKSVDWREKGAVTSVDRQGGCVVCWAFAACGALEGARFIKTGNLTKLSAQNLVDCVDEGQSYCYFGTSMNAYNYIRRNRGIDTDQSYPFEEKKDKCNYNPKNNAGVRVRGYVRLPSGDESALVQAIATVGPITAAIDSRPIQDYKGGVFHDEKCTQQLTHEILVVGYGTDDNDGDYFIIKNSYGTSWGENGFMKMARNKNLCGIANAAGYPIIY